MLRRSKWHRVSFARGSVLLKIPAHSLARDTRQPGNVLVRQPLALQP